MLTGPSLAKMKAIEDHIYDQAGFSDVCWKSMLTGECMRPQSITQWAYPTAHPHCATSGVNDGNGTVQATKDQMKSAINTAFTSPPVRHFPARFRVPALPMSASLSGPRRTVFHDSPPRTRQKRSDLTAHPHCADVPLLRLFCFPPLCKATGGYYCNLFGSPAATDCATMVCPQFNDTYNSYVAKTWNPDAFSSYLSRGTIVFGLPLEGFASSNDRYDDQIKKIEDFVADQVPYLESDAANEQFELRFMSPVTIKMHFDGLVVNDALLVLASIAMVWAYMWFHTKSLFLASFGIGHILLSFPFAYFFLQLILYPKAMGFLNFMSLFIILGIGADDVFILVDAWKQSEEEFPMPPLPARGVACGGMSGEEFRWLHNRLVWSYTRASWAMLVTSFTTSAAFMMNMVSSIPPIQIFGFFTAFMVLTNYFMVITYYPALMMFYEKFVKDRVCGAWHPCCESSEWAGPCQTDKCCACCKVPAAKPGVSDADADAARQGRADGVVANIADYRYLERKLYSDYAPWVIKWRWHIVATAAVWFVLTIVYATKLSPSETPEQFVTDDDPIQQAVYLENNGFAKAAFLRQVNVLNGVGKIDREGKNYVSLPNRFAAMPCRSLLG